MLAAAAHRTVLVCLLAATLAAAFFAPLGISASHAAALASAAPQGTLAVVPYSWCAGSPLPC